MYASGVMSPVPFFRTTVRRAPGANSMVRWSQSRVPAGPEIALYRSRTAASIPGRSGSSAIGAVDEHATSSAVRTTANRMRAILLVSNRLVPLVGPFAEGVDGRSKRATLFGQRVFDADRRLGDDCTLDDRLALELL